MSDGKKVTVREANSSSDSDCSCCDYECCSCVDELRVYKHMVSKCSTSPIQASKALVSLVVKPSDNIHSFDQDSWSAMKSKNEVDNAVMSLSDLDHYDIMLQGLIDELSTISEELVSCL